MKFPPRAVLLTVSVVLGTASLSGCGSGGQSGTVPPPPPPTGSLLVSGKVLAGSQPIVGASVQVYSAGTSGNGSGATALLSSPVTTDASGGFAITSGLSCSTSAPMVYLVARGGQVGSAAANSATALAAAVGDCSKLSTTTTTAFTVNEVTTVAFTWSLAQFLSAGGVVGASSTNVLGLANAFATAANIADASQGKAPGAAFPSTGKAPVAKINSLANLLNSCLAASSACSAFFSATMASGQSAPANTLDAAMGLARNPGLNVGALYTQSATSTAFSPALTKAPTDWTLSISFTGGGMNYPTGIGADSQGNVWVANYGQANAQGLVQGVVSKFSPTGSPVFASGVTGGGLGASFGLAIDSQDNVWIPNEYSASSVNSGYGSVTEVSSSGQLISGTNGFTAGGLSYPVALAVDPNGKVWTLNYRNSTATLLSSVGTPLSGATGYTAKSMAFVVSVAVDASHNAWVGDQNDTVVTRLSQDGSQSAGISCCDGPQGLAIDQRGYVWAANAYGDSVSQVSSTGTVVSAGYSGGGLAHPQGIAVDGAGTVWVLSLHPATGAANPVLTELAGSGASNPGAILSPAAGWLADANMLQPYGVAIDASGNLWITNFVNDSRYPASNSITEVVGMAAPVKTPVIGPPQAP